MVIIENIKKRSTELTRKQYMVAMYMIDHPDEMAYITLKELSQNIGVTEITIHVHHLAMKVLPRLNMNFARI